MHLFDVGTCQDAGQFGWSVGVASGVFAAAAITILIASAPRLGPSRPAGSAARQAPRSALQNLLGPLLIALWIAGGWYADNFVACYAANVAGPVAVLVGLVVLLVMFTAANQVGTRSIR